ncbi:MAG: hypothetical protein CL833_02845 [Crocinitomicaceae bacterium]|nr:hypothetical protein [Crocinitomicaceae bacterium]
MIVNLNETRYYYLTTGNHADREHHVEQLLKGKLLKKIKPFETECSRKDIAGTNKGTSGSIGHARMAQQGLLDQARDKPFQPFVMLEDDVSFFHEFVESIDIPDDADMVYLGNSQLSVHSTKNFSTDLKAFEVDENVLRIFNMLSGHAILICSAVGASAYQNAMIDGFYSGKIWDCFAASSQDYYNIYCLKQPIFIQNEKLGGKEAATNFVLTNKSFVDPKTHQSVSYGKQLFSAPNRREGPKIPEFFDGAARRIATQKKSIDDHLCDLGEIQKKIHVSWKTKKCLDSQNPLMLNGLKNLVDLNPEWQLEISNDSDVEKYLKESLSSTDYNLLKDQPMVPKVDVWRLLKMTQEGGLYLDIDRYCNKSIDSILKDQTKCVLPFHKPKDRIIDFSQDIMLTAANNPIHKLCLEWNLRRRRSGWNDILLLAPITYFHAITYFLLGIPLERYPNQEQIDQLNQIIDESIFLDSCIESLPHKNLLFEFNENTFKPGNGQDKNAFYNESNVEHWTVKNKINNHFK